MTSFESIMRRKERPLPKTGCSIAFYLMLTIMAIAILIVFFIYKHQ